MASHLPNLSSRRDELEFVGVCRKGRAQLDFVKDAFGFEVASEDYRDVLAAGVDIVIVGSPASLHYDHARAALEAGAHVLVEKPFTLTSDQAWELVSMAQSRSLELVVAFGYNYKDLVVAAGQALRRHGGVGHLESLSVSMASVCRDVLSGKAAYPKASKLSRPDPATWADPRLSGGGYVQAQLSHAFGLALQLFDVAPRSVSACAYTPGEVEVEYHCSAMVQWEGGAIGTVTGSATHEGSAGNRDWLRVGAVGEEGQFFLDMDGDRFTYFTTGGGEHGYQGEAGAGAYDCSGPPSALVDVAWGRLGQNLSPGRLGARTVELTEAIYTSLRTGGAVEVRSRHLPVR